MELGGGIDIGQFSGREVVEDVHLMTALQKSIYDMRGDKPRAAGDNYFHAFVTCTWARKYSMVFSSPSSSPTLGSHWRMPFALVISGWRTCGSSSGKGLKTMVLLESVSSIIFSAKSSTDISCGLPIMTGR